MATAKSTGTTKKAASTTQKTTTAKPAAKKTTTATTKKVAAAKPAAKPAAAKKPAVRKTAAAKLSPTPEERYRMVQEAAYYIAEKHGFGGADMDYWIMAEAEIQTMISGKQK
ncbi:MAG: DUF2934 domain-containing protein [Pseudomonadota bacterium]